MDAESEGGVAVLGSVDHYPIGVGERCGIPVGRRERDGGLEALRLLKRRLSDVAYKALLDDLTAEMPAAA